MAKYVHYSPDNGLILQWMDTEAHSYNLPNEESLHKCTENEWVLQFANIPLKVQNGVIVPHVEEPMTLYNRRQIVINKAKEQRKLNENGGVCVTGGYWFETDTNSMQRYLILNQTAKTDNVGNLLIGGKSINWKTMTGELVILTISLLSEILDKATPFAFLCYQHYQILVEEINKSDSPEDVNVIIGWPGNYYNR